jgi:hypothetical protein
MLERKRVNIKDLIINPTNARFTIPLNDMDEKVAIEALCTDTDNHMDRLLQDIAENNLNSNELPIIMPSEMYDGKYEIMDGNRRLTCVKLLIQYKDKLDKFKIPRSIVNAIQRIKTINVDENIECVYSDDEAYVNNLLEKLHTFKTGISTVPWKPTAQERHNLNKGTLTKINALIKFLETSKYSNENIKKNLNRDKWVNKFKRFINNNKTIRNYFGFEFSNNLDEIIMYINEQEIVKGLAQLLQDSIDKTADGFAQKEKERNEYLDNFRNQRIVDLSRINNPVLTYSITDGHISTTTLIPFPNPENLDENKEKLSNPNDQGNHEKKLSNGKPMGQENNSKKSSNQNHPDRGNGKQEPPNPNHANQKNNKVEPNDVNKNQTTESRPYLIPKNIPYTVSDQRTVDLLNELQTTYIKGHRNLIAIGFRSLIEFSVSVFIEKKSKSYNSNGKNLLDKIEHTVGKLESIHGQKVLKTIMPKIYQVIDAKSNTISQFGDISMFNLFVHHYKYHPQEEDLKVIYNNYEPYLKLLWEEINK